MTVGFFFSVFFFFAFIVKMVSYHLSGFHLHQVFFSSHIKYSGLLCICCPVEMIIFNPPNSVPAQTNVLQMISLLFYYKNYNIFDCVFLRFLHYAIIFLNPHPAAGHRQKKL